MSEQQSGKTVLLEGRPVPPEKPAATATAAPPTEPTEPAAATEPSQRKARWPWLRWWMVPAAAAPLLLAGALAWQSDSRTALDSAPEHALLVLDADVRGLRESSLAKVTEELVRAHTPLDQLSAVCGFAALERIEQAALSVGNGKAGGLGVALQGTLSRSELDVCQRALTIAAEGGSSNRLGDSVVRGGYMVAPMHLADRDVALAVGLRRPLLVGTPSWVEQMVDATETPAAGLLARLTGRGAGRRGEHARMLERIEAQAAGLPLLLRASLEAPEGTAAMLQQARLFLPTEPLRERARAIGQVRAAGAALSLSRDGQQLALRIVADAGSDESALALRDVVLGLRLHFSQQLELRLVGAGPLLDKLQAQAEGSWVELSVEDRTEDMVKTLQSLYTALRSAKK